MIISEETYKKLFGSSPLDKKVEPTDNGNALYEGMACAGAATDADNTNLSGHGLMSQGDSNSYAFFTLKNGYAVYRHEDTGGGADMTSTTMVADNAWHHIQFVNNSDDTGALYVDGVSEASGSSGIWQGASRYYFQPHFISRDWKVSAYVYTSGVMDEPRMSLASRSASWISTEYANQRYANTFFLSVGDPCDPATCDQVVLVPAGRRRVIIQ